MEVLQKQKWRKSTILHRALSFNTKTFSVLDENVKGRQAEALRTERGKGLRVSLKAVRAKTLV